MIFSRDIGIDLGTANTVICDKKGRIIIREPSVVAVDVKTKRVLATGDEAKTMIGRTPGSIIAVRPLQDGVIADFDMTSDMLRSFIYRSSRRNLFTRTRVVVSVPSGVTEVEERAVIDAATQAGAGRVHLIEEPLAAAIGVGIDITQPCGSMVIDMGGGTTDIAVISLGGIVHSASIRIAGDTFDEAIIKYIRRKYNILVGERTAEELKTKLGCVSKRPKLLAMEVRGRSLISGLPKTLQVTSDEMYEAMSEVSGTIVDSVKNVLEETPPELVSDISNRGIILTGGGATMYGFGELIRSQTGIKTVIASEPDECVAQGTGKALENISLLKTYNERRAAR